MAEAAAAAAVIGIVDFGIHLVGSLYKFGSNVSSAREDTGRIARHIDLYANVLDVLQDRIDDEEPILKHSALDLIDELKYQSEKLFTSVESLLPDVKHGNDNIKFREKLKWNFRKSRVDYLVGEIDHLRNTVNLLVSVIFAGRGIQSYSRRKRDAKDDDRCRRDLQTRLFRAQNAVLVHHEGQEKLLNLTAKASENQGSSPSHDGAHKTDSYQQSEGENIICTASSALSELQQTLASYTDPSERQRIVLQQSSQVLQQLVQDWIEVDLLDIDVPADDHRDQPVNQQTSDPSSAKRSQKGQESTSSGLPEIIDVADDATRPSWSETYNPPNERFYHHDYAETRSQRGPHNRSNPSANVKHRSTSKTSIDLLYDVLDQQLKKDYGPSNRRHIPNPSPDTSSKDRYQQNVTSDDSPTNNPVADLFNKFLEKPFSTAFIQQPWNSLLPKENSFIGAQKPRRRDTSATTRRRRIPCSGCGGRGTSMGWWGKTSCKSCGYESRGKPRGHVIDVD